MLRSRRSTISGRSKVLITTVVFRAGLMQRLPVPETRLWRRPRPPSGLLGVHLQGYQVAGHALRRPATPQAEDPLAPAPGPRRLHEADAIPPALDLGVDAAIRRAERAHLGLGGGPRLHRHEQLRQAAQVDRLVLPHDPLLQGRSDIALLAPHDRRSGP